MSDQKSKPSSNQEKNGQSLEPKTNSDPGSPGELGLELKRQLEAHGPQGKWQVWKKMASTAFFFFCSLGLLYFSLWEYLRQGFSWGLVAQVAFGFGVLSGSFLGIRNRWNELRFGSSWPEDWWGFRLSSNRWIFTYKKKEEKIRDPKTLVKVTIENTASGPFGADLFWKLDFEQEESLHLPLGKNLRNLQDELLRLPNFQLEAFIESSLTAEPGQRICWERQSTKGQG